MESDTQKARKLWALTQTMKESLQLPTIKTFFKQTFTCKFTYHRGYRTDREYFQGGEYCLGKQAQSGLPQEVFRSEIIWE